MVTIYTSPWGELDHIPTGNAIDGYNASPLHTNMEKLAAIDAGTGKTISFREMRLAYSKFATVLRTKYGINKGDVVCLFGHNTPYMQAVHFSILTLGAVVSPVNVMYTSEELAHQLSMVRAKMIYAAPDVMETALAGIEIVASKHPDIKTTVKPYDEIIQEIAAVVHDDSIHLTSPVDLDGREHAAYYCFSSGTSGLPKGVEITHTNILSNCLQTTHVYMSKREENADDIHGAFLPMSHIMGLNAFVWSIPYYGNSQVVMARFDFVAMLQAVIKYRVNRLALVPPMMNAVARHPVVDQFLKHLDSLVKSIKVGAAPTAAATLDAAQKRFPQAEFTQGYGMTETSPVTLISGWQDNKDYNFASSGWLVPSCEARIVDAFTGQDAVEGGRGEFWVRGPNIMKGYLNNPEATAATMAPGGWLKTGDVVVRDKTGQYYVVDRIKELIKSMGHQVAPAELEGILLTNQFVADAAVIGVADDELGTEKPRAYVVMQPGHEGRADEVAKWFNKKVAKPKRLWGGVVVIDAIPKSPSGKILRRELKERVNSNIDEPMCLELAKI